uniref:Uncharacterized protein n=1 Tax=Aegilops tauschii subsp. strangulata TaxID=200361 RepID=A0A453Q287_AEGTS
MSWSRLVATQANPSRPSHQPTRSRPAPPAAAPGSRGAGAAAAADRRLS